jgi:uncharacterized protein with FMN-binding domain
MKRADQNARVDGVAFVVALVVVSTGLVMRYALPPGSGRTVGMGGGPRSLDRQVSVLWGMTRHGWGDLHYWASLVLVAVLAAHGALHFKWISSMLRGQHSDASGKRLTVGAVALLFLIVALSLPLFVEPEHVSRRDLIGSPAPVAVPGAAKHSAEPTHTGSARGYEGPIRVEVVMQASKIIAVTVREQRESRPRNALTEIPRRIVEQQRFDVDSVSGASVTSRAIMAAAVAASAAQ